jgi:hypothetical protein
MNYAELKSEIWAEMVVVVVSMTVLKENKRRGIRSFKMGV